MKRGKFITLEGIEGVGKTTHLEFIAGYLRNKGYQTLVSREPGGTRLGESIREILLHGGHLKIDPVTELLLVFSARSQHLKEVVLPALSRGVAVICDRFTDATYAYQGGGRGIAENDIRVLEQYVQKGLVPDLTLLFDAAVETGRRRAGKRGGADRFESEAAGFFERVRQAYLDRAKREPERIRVIDAERDISSIEKEIGSIVETVL
jgi:dTMP kinase